MHVVLRCPCGANLKADLKHVGKQTQCPKCGTKLIVPEPPVAAANPEVVELEELGMSQPAAGAWQAPQASMPAAAPVHPGHAPAPKKARAAKGSSLTSWIITGSVVGVAVLGFVAYLTWTYVSSRNELASSMKTGRKFDTKGARPIASNPTAPGSEPLAPGEENPYDSGEKDLVASSEAGTLEALDMADLIDLVEPSIVRIKVRGSEGEGVGSGFFVGKDGMIITNYHVIQGANTVTVSTADNKKTEALGFLAVEPTLDLAIIQIDPEDLDVVPIAVASSLPRKGEDVAAFGAPQGFSFSATDGTISGIRSGEEVKNVLREMSNVNVYGLLGYTVDTTWIQTTAAISGGNSGGPLVNMRGEMIGVNTWTHPEGQNLNFSSTHEKVAEVFANRDGQMREWSDLPQDRIRSQVGF